MALLDHRRELSEERSVGFSARHTRQLRAERQVRLSARRDLREEGRELVVTREAGRAQGRRTPRLVTAKSRAQETHGLTILCLGERAQTACVELALARAPLQEHGRRLPQRRTQR